MNQVLAMHTQHIPYQDGFVAWHEFGNPVANQLPLILLHGGHGSWEHWARNTDSLAQHFHVFVPDMPGFGESSFVTKVSGTSTILCQVAGTRIALSHDAAVNILVEPLTRG